MIGWPATGTQIGTATRQTDVWEFHVASPWTSSTTATVCPTLALMPGQEAVPVPVLELELDLRPRTAREANVSAARSLAGTIVARTKRYAMVA